MAALSLNRFAIPPSFFQSSNHIRLVIQILELFYIYIYLFKGIVCVLLSNY